MTRKSIGERRNLFTLESPTRASNGAGGRTVTWVTVKTLRGSLEMDGQEDASAGGKVQGARKGWIQCRNESALTNKMRLVLGSRTFYVLATDVPERARGNDQMRIRVEERV